MFGLLQKAADEISTLSIFLFLWWRAPINVSIEVQKAARTDLLYHALHGSQMPKVKCNQWARLFHSFPWLRQKQRVNPSLLLTGSLPVREAECQGEKETPGRGWERIYQRGHSIFRKTLLWNLMCKHSHRSFWRFSSSTHILLTYIPSLPFSQQWCCRRIFTVTSLFGQVSQHDMAVTGSRCSRRILEIKHFKDTEIIHLCFHMACMYMYSFYKCVCIILKKILFALI